eukprot:Lithocolla_globosa_v1_NODE_6425_length_1089_cov_39.829787.p1 type:complete len:160 gc:universal NODE_6425_length_1089_cov_39.829787:1008-529(-)
MWGKLEEGEESQTFQIDVEKSRYPYCIVWTPIPCLTWIFPFIGHMGIATSNGYIYDFAGPYFVSVDDMAFGTPTRYLQLDPKKAQIEEWDDSVTKASTVYRKRMHILCWDNCHSHVAMCLEHMKYNGIGYWNMVILKFFFSNFLTRFLIFKFSSLTSLF